MHHYLLKLRGFRACAETHLFILFSLTYQTPPFLNVFKNFTNYGISLINLFICPKVNGYVTNKIWLLPIYLITLITSNLFIFVQLHPFYI